MPGETVDGNDVEAVHAAMQRAVERARGGQGPTLLECVTYRWRGHFEGDPQPYRTAQEVETWKIKDPLKLTEARLVEREIATRTEIDAIWSEIKADVDRAVEFARCAAEADPRSALEDVYTDIVAEDWP